MINGIGNTYQSLQGLQASRSFQDANKTTSVFRQALEHELSDTLANPQQDFSPQSQAPSESRANVLQNPELSRPSGTTQQQSQAFASLQPMIQEVQQIAESAGYIGVTSQDVLRAYQSGQSLLANYQV